MGPPEIEKITGIRRGWIREAFRLGHLRGIRVGHGKRRNHFRATEMAVAEWLIKNSYGEDAGAHRVVLGSRGPISKER